MSQTMSITQSAEIAVIMGAYYELFLRQSEADKNTKQAEPKFYEQFSCVFHPPLMTSKSPSFEDSQRFKQFATHWRNERHAASSVTDMAMCPSYQKIIAMGEVAIPLVLSELQSAGDEPDHWFWALRVLTDADPVKDEHRGDIAKMAAAWLDWGRKQGYAW